MLANERQRLSQVPRDRSSASCGLPVSERTVCCCLSLSSSNSHLASFNCNKLSNVSASTPLCVIIKQSAAEPMRVCGRSGSAPRRSGSGSGSAPRRSGTPLFSILTTRVLKIKERHAWRWTKRWMNIPDMNMNRYKSTSNMTHIQCACSTRHREGEQ